MQDEGFGRNRQDDTWDKVNQIRDKFEYDRKKRMEEKGKFNGHSFFMLWFLNS